MKLRTKRLLSIGLAAAMTVGLLAGCGKKGGSDNGGSDEDGITTLKWYMSINPVAADTDKVIEKLNEYTRDKIGVEIDYNVIANPDYKEKMPNLINAGEYFDICFTANWTTDYLQFVGKDAYMDITDLLPEYAKETYDFIPQEVWDTVKVDGQIYGVPSYKEMGWQGGIVYNSDLAEEYGIDMSQVATLEDYTKVLETVAEKSKAAGQDVIGVSGLVNAWPMAAPYESLTGNSTLPVNYDSDTANRDNDFNNGKLFSYFIKNAPGNVEMMSNSSGHGVGFVSLMDPLFETTSVLSGGILAISSASEHPEKALEFINLLNTDEYVGTLIRHGIEGEHYTEVGDNQVDRTMGGTLDPADNGYDYTYGWQFGTPFNQKWDISYPDNIEELFQEYNDAAVISQNNGFSFDMTPVETQVAALTNVIAEYGPSLETGSVDPEEYIPSFLKDLEANGAQDLIDEVTTQVEEYQSSK